MTVPYTFATATTSIPLSQLDSNFATAITLGNTAVQLGNTITTINNTTLANTTISSGNSTVTTANATTINATTINVATHRSDANLTFQTNGTTTAMFIDTSQNVGIGTSSPTGKLDVVATSATSYLNVRSSGIANSAQIVQDTGGTAYFQNTYASGDIILGTAGSNAIFKTSSTERMRIDSSGNLLVGTTSLFSGNERVSVKFSSNSGPGLILSDSTIQNGTTFAGFYASSTRIGSITANGTTAVAYNTSSDYRLKDNVQPMTTGLATIGALKPVTYEWISDKSAGEGFIAHELQAVIPHAVTGEKDAVNEDGTIKPQGVDYSKIVVHLVAALQEANAKIDAQAADIAALKAKVGM